VTVADTKASALVLAAERGYVKPHELPAPKSTTHRALNELVTEGRLQKARAGLYQIPGDARPAPTLNAKWQRHRAKKEGREVDIAFLPEKRARQIGNGIQHEPESAFASDWSRNSRQRARIRIGRVGPRPVPFDFSKAQSERALESADERRFDDTTADPPPPRPMDERVLAALAMPGQSALNLYELSGVMFGKSKARERLEELETLTRSMLNDGSLDVDWDGRFCLPPTQE
jgi:hypothetical protein